MKNIKIITILSLLFLSPIFAEEKVNYSEKFLGLLYNKTELYADKGEAAVSYAIDKVGQEVPLLMEEFIKWRILSHLWDGLPCIIVSFMSINLLLFIWWRNKDVEEVYFKYEWPTGLGIIFIILCVVCFFSTYGVFIGPPSPNSGSSLNDIKMAFQAYYAPKIYILDAFSQYAKELSK